MQLLSGTLKAATCRVSSRLWAFMAYCAISCMSQSHFENIALKGTCRMESQLQGSGGCHNAIDNDTSTLYRNNNDPKGSNCLHTSKDISKSCRPFWELNLRRYYTIYNVTIYIPNQSLNHLSHTHISVDDKLCKAFGEIANVSQSFINFLCLQPFVGSRVIIRRQYPKCVAEENFSLVLCEVQVWVCSRGWFGYNCNSQCSEHCEGGIEECDRYNGTCFGGCKSGWYRHRCDLVCRETCGGICNKFTGVCSGTQNIWNPKAGIILSIIYSILALLGILSVIYKLRLLRKRKSAENLSLVQKADIRARRALYKVNAYSVKRSGKKAFKKVTLVSKNFTFHLDELANRGCITQDKLMIYDRICTAPEWDDVQQLILSTIASGMIYEQFRSFPTGLQYQHESGLNIRNAKKNRFDLVIPYDMNRVILMKPKGDDTDYINASRIKGYKEEHNYIATQGPLERTSADMWKMIWQEHVTHIVMLTKLIELEQEACAQYWPERESCKSFGEWIIFGKDEEFKSDFVIRSFILTTSQIWANYESEERHVVQFHYLGWPDTGVPSTASFANFWTYIRTHTESAPFTTVVQCSAGAGRTGVYIALDIAMNEIENTGTVNVYKIVKKLQDSRCNMIQNGVQYKFIYDVILEAYTNRFSRRSVMDFNEEFPCPIHIDMSNEQIDNEFKKLQLLKKCGTSQRNRISLKKENFIKIRDPSFLPDDRHLVHLRGRVPGQNGFINAVILSGGCLILTQLPLPETLPDIWKLVDEEDIRIIVSIGSEHEENEVENYCQYWPRKEGEVVTASPYRIEFHSYSLEGDNLVLYHVCVERGDTTRVVRVIHYNDWVGEVPAHTRDLTDIVLYLIRNRFETVLSPILIQCLDGTTKSSIFCTLFEIVQRALSEHVIDVFAAARHVQYVKPQAVSSLIQYRFCYMVAQKISSAIGNGLM